MSLFGGNIARTPNWNSGIEAALEGPDEISFFRQMLADLEERYPIDPERIYVSGHSNGSAMTQRLMRLMPEVFAGFNPVGGIEGNAEGKAVPQPDDTVRPVWYILGEYDRAGMYLDGLTAEVFESLCKTNRCSFENRTFYESGIQTSPWRKTQKEIRSSNSPGSRTIRIPSLRRSRSWSGTTFSRSFAAKRTAALNISAERAAKPIKSGDPFTVT